MAALWAACAATGHPPSFAVLIIAYNVGYIAGIIPIPAGIGVLDGGIAAALVLYGMSPSGALAAVLVYHAIAVWLPAFGGLDAWARLRHDRDNSQHDLPSCPHPPGLQRATATAIQGSRVRLHPWEVPPSDSPPAGRRRRPVLRDVGGRLQAWSSQAPRIT
jgi:hypothetical protein